MRKAARLEVEKIWGEEGAAGCARRVSGVARAAQHSLCRKLFIRPARLHTSPFVGRCISRPAPGLRLLSAWPRRMQVIPAHLAECRLLNAAGCGAMFCCTCSAPALPNLCLPPPALRKFASQTRADTIGKVRVAASQCVLLHVTLYCVHKRHSVLVLRCPPHRCCAGSLHNRLPNGRRSATCNLFLSHPLVSAPRSNDPP